MEKAHLYEALYLVNHGIDEAVRGVQRLKNLPTLHGGLPQVHGWPRTSSFRINLQFMLELRKLEEDDESRFEENTRLALRRTANPTTKSVN